ncbi:MAG: peptide chain release factor N(5)-glutamine methyltransferase [Parcubacteria group bacterium]|nr:peptide chain release factor N(5)-glutamine methyltransferase [Parcubacteria group bacterium]
MTVQDVRHLAFDRVKRVAPHLVDDIDLLLAHATGHDRAWLMAHGESELTTQEQQNFLALVDRRRRHEPVAYLTGWQEFYGRRFFVDKRVLIPRPESELIIDQLRHDFAGRNNLDIVDVGTGSGCLAVTAALLFPAGRTTAIDFSKETLAVAEQNAQALGATNISFFSGDLLKPLYEAHGKADAILANLPYLAPSDIASSPTRNDLSFEPKESLLAEDDGLAMIKDCTRQAVDILRRGGQLYLEMMPRQVSIFLSWLAHSHLPYTSIVKQDLAGFDRLVVLTFVGLPAGQPAA